MNVFAVLIRTVPLLFAALAGCGAARDSGPAAAAGNVTEYAIPYRDTGAAAAHGDMDHAGSTHEIVFDQRRNMLWISGQNHDALVRVRFDGAGVPHMGIEPMPCGPLPAGIGSIAMCGTPAPSNRTRTSAS